MVRLFAAIVPPPEIRDALLAGMGGVAGARWQRDAQLHLTLRFIGEVDRHRAADVAAALALVRPPDFAARLEPAGTFDRHGRIHSLWVGVGPLLPLAALARGIDRALVRHAALAAETRAFVPHITVARFGRTAGPVAAYLAQPVPAGSFIVRGFDLFESQLGHGGSEYRRLRSYGLASVAIG